MSLEEENAALRAENDALRRELNALREQVEHLTAALHAAQARIAELEARKPPPPAFVKANVPPRPKRPRKKRAPEHNHARRLEPPTQVIVHQIDTCPACHGRLSSRTLARRRQIIEVPLPPPVQIIEHQVFKGWCSYCRAWQEAPVDVSGQVVGQGRIGVGLASLITHLRLVVRAPIRVIQAWLSSVSGVHLSVGELVDLLRRVAVLAQPALVQLRERARASPAVHADETGWREGGQNGYVWVLATAAGDRYCEYHHSRAGAVINAMLGEDFGGVVESDFYGGYNDTPGGRHQRGFAHLLRDLHGLKQDHAEALEVVVWAKAVKDLYLLAHAWLAEGVERKQAYRELVLLVRALGEQFARDHRAIPVKRWQNVCCAIKTTCFCSWWTSGWPQITTRLNARCARW